MNPVWATVAELSRAFGARTLSPVDVVDALMKRIGTRNPSLHAYIAVYEADARLAAEAADKAIRSGHRVGPLHGVPIALKDLVDLEGRVTTGGSKAWADRVSPVTATLAERLIAAGMIVLGKTHTVEFAMGSWGTNTHMGTPRNPWDLKVHRTPGGSSSGSGVAVAAGLAPVAIGTDTGGSVRIPAAWNGIVGLKVTAGRISTYGVLPRRDRAHHRRRGLSLRRAPSRRREPSHRPTRASANPARPGDLGPRLFADPRGARRAQARVRRGAGRCRRAADADGPDRGDSDRARGSVGDRGALHPSGQLPRALRSRRPERIHRGGHADVAPGPLPRRRRSDGAAHRLGLRAGDRLVIAPAARALKRD